MKKKFSKNFKVFNLALIVTVSMFLCMVSFAPALSNTYNSTSDESIGALLMKVIVGRAYKCNGDPASGGSVSVTSGLGSRSGTVLGDGNFQVGISGSGPGDPDWPAGTSFTVSVSLTDGDGSFSGSKSGTVSSGTVTDVGTVTLDPTTLVASGSGLPLSGDAPLSVDFTGSATGGCKPYTWYWDFDGDGSSSLQSPTHVFNTPGTYNCVLTVTDDCSNTDDSPTVTITFQTYTLGTSMSGSGSGTIEVSPSGPTYVHGTTATLWANASGDSDFVLWSGDLGGSTTPTTLYMDDDKNVDAQFDLKGYTLGTSMSGSGSGTLEVSPSGPTYVHGTTVTLWANASIGSTFDGWSGDLGGSTTPTTLYMDDNKNVDAEFSLEDVITVNIDLYAGWNLLTIPINNSWNASDIDANVSGCISVVKWNASDQSYWFYLPGTPAFDFQLIPGHGYFVEMSGSDTLSITGPPIDNVNVTLKMGWNIIGWYKNANTNAISLAENITGCTSVVKWNVSDQSYWFYLPGTPIFDFIITQGMGIFVEVSEDSYWLGEG
ncbi:PKD domain-containing protein [Thermoplasmatota archaeon]